MSEHYEFTTQDMLHTFTTHVQGGSEADFFIWLTAHEEQIRQEERENITAAEQRGAARGKVEGLREAADEAGSWGPACINAALAIRRSADLLEGDDE